MREMAIQGHSMSSVVVSIDDFDFPSALHSNLTSIFVLVISRLVRIVYNLT